jgi:RimJ/RimL family protein N-acetyltransferase
VSFDRMTSARLVIRRFGPGDADAFAAYRSDPEVARYQDWALPYSMTEARTFIADLEPIAPGTPGSWFQFAVCLASDGTLIGDVALHTMTDAREGELGFTFATAGQGRGYATEAVRRVLQYAFGRLALQRVIARTDLRNVRAQRLLERVGFRREDVPERVWFKGEWATDVLYVLPDHPAAVVEAPQS